MAGTVDFKDLVCGGQGSALDELAEGCRVDQAALVVERLHRMMFHKVRCLLMALTRRS